MEIIENAVEINEIKRNFPDQWILLGNPKIDERNQAILSGVVLYHSHDKREVCYLGKSLVMAYDKTALFFNRVTPRKKRDVMASLFYPVKQ